MSWRAKSWVTSRFGGKAPLREALELLDVVGLQAVGIAEDADERLLPGKRAPAGVWDRRIGGSDQPMVVGPVPSQRCPRGGSAWITLTFPICPAHPPGYRQALAPPLRGRCGR